MENNSQNNENQPTVPFKPQAPAALNSSGPAPAPNQPGRKPARWPLYVALGVAVFIVVAVAGFFGLNAVLDGPYKGKIEPGVSISGVYVGEMTREEARARLQQALEGYTTRPVVLSFQDRTWSPTLEQLGVTINLDGSLDKAEAFGKEGWRLFKQMSPASTNLPIEIMFDEAKLDGYLSDISDLIRRDTVEPDVKLTPEGKLEVVEGKDGFNVDNEATFAAIKERLQTLTPGNENLLQAHNVPPVIATQEIEEFKASLAPLLSGPVTFSFKDKNWTFDQKTIAAQVTISRNTDKKQAKHFSYTFNKAYFEKYVAGLAKDVNQEARNGELGFKGGKVVFTKPGQNGQSLNVGRTMDNLNQAFVATDPEKRKTYLWVDITEPEVSAEKPQKLGNFDLIGEGVSSFSGSAYERATNIKVGASYLTETFIRPHATFSFLDSIGEISVKRGYVKGYAIVADQTVPDVGGGICQVSTTTFRAAFFAGLPIVERHPHAYRVSWYEEMGEPVGFDAAVYQPGVDLKFQNPTDYYMAVVAFVENGRLYVRILGNKVAGQKVELVHNGVSNVTDPPPDKTEVDPTLAPGTKKQVDFAHKGLNTSITRIVKVNGDEVKRDTFATRFQPWPNIFKVGPEKKPDPTTPASTTAPAQPTTPGASKAPAQPTTPAPTTPAPTNPPVTTPASTTKK